MSSFISSSGLTYLWSKIKEYISAHAGTYSKPSTGIPKTDLASAVQTSLGKADTALQSYTETDPTVPDWAKSPYPPSYSYSDVGALNAYSYVDGVGFNGGSNINHYNTCSTSASTAAKTVSKSNFQLSAGAEIIVQFIYTNTASYPTLNVNSTGAKSIYYNGTNIPASALAANRVYKFVYDGSYWQLVGTLGYSKTSELTNDAGFLTSADVVDEVNQENKPVTSNAVYEYITEDEKVIASALNDLNGRIGGVETTVSENEVVTAAALNDLNRRSTALETSIESIGDLISSANLGDLSDVTISSPTNNQGLIYNSSTGKWVNGTISGGGSGGGDVNIIETVKVNGTALTPDSNKAVNISAVTSFNGSTGAVTYSAPVTSVNGNTGAVVLNIPAAVTESTVSGWGFTKNSGTITGVTGSNGLTGSGTSGSVTISHAAPSTSPAKTTSAVYPITIDQYGHITAAGSAVTIPTQVTESTVSGWGFTKNAGTITGVTGSNGLTGSGTSGSVTISHAAPSTSPAKTTQAVYPIKIDQYGHITAAGTAVTIPSAPGTLNTNNTTAQTASSSEALSGTIKLHKVAKTGTYSDLIGTPTNVSTFTNDANYVTSNNAVAIYSGSSAPSSSLGKNGDIYIQTS